MKLGKEPRPLHRKLKAPDLLQPAEVESEVNFWPERDLGEGFRLDLLQQAEAYLKQKYDVDGTAKHFISLAFLAVHKLLFPRQQTELDDLIKQYKVKEEVVNPSQWGGYMEKMILFPELKTEFAKQAARQFENVSTLFSGVDMDLVLLGNTITSITSVKPELRKSLRVDTRKLGMFRRLEQLFQRKEWTELLEFGGKVRLMFPEDFSTEFLGRNDWKEMIKEVKDNPRRPDLAIWLGILAAEKVHFQPEGEVRIELRVPALKAKQPLPPRDQV